MLRNGTEVITRVSFLHGGDGRDNWGDPREFAEHHEFIDMISTFQLSESAEIAIVGDDLGEMRIEKNGTARTTGSEPIPSGKTCHPFTISQIKLAAEALLTGKAVSINTKTHIIALHWDPFLLHVHWERI